MSRHFSAPLRLSFDYTRSVGPLLSQFFTALRERRILGVRGSDGRVHVPPAEYDPVDYAPLTEVVPVASVGTVVSWTWQEQPLEGQPLDRPFRVALIKLDGADTPLLHAVGAGSSNAISTGARVHVHWADEPVGSITDIAYFALGDVAEEVPEPTPGASEATGEKADEREPVTLLVVPSAIEIQHNRVAAREHVPARSRGGQADRAHAILDGAVRGRCTSLRARPIRPPAGNSPSSSSCPTRAR